MRRGTSRASAAFDRLDGRGRPPNGVHARVGANILRELDGLLATFIVEVTHWLAQGPFHERSPASTMLRRLDLPFLDIADTRLRLVNVALHRRRLRRRGDEQRLGDALDGTATCGLYTSVAEELFALALERRRNAPDQPSATAVPLLVRTCHR